MTTSRITLGGIRTQAVALNERWQVIGIGQTATGEDHGFVWENGAITDLGTSSIALAINKRGQVVGSSTTAGGAGHAVIWEKRSVPWR